MMTVNEAAKIMNIKPKTLYTWIRKGKLKARKIGRKTLRIDEEEFNRFIGK